MKDFFTRNRTISIAVIGLLLVIWELVSRITGARQILPGPADSITALIHLFGEPGFLSSLTSTIIRGLLGFISFGCALVIGILSGLNPVVEAAFRPIIVLFRSVPVISIILLALICLSGAGSGIIGFLTMFPLLSTNLNPRDPANRPEAGRDGPDLSCQRWRILREVYIPSILPTCSAGSPRPWVLGGGR